MAGAAVLFSLMNFFAKLATTSSSWMTAGAVRALVGAFVAIGVARLRGASLAIKDRRAIFWRSLVGTLAMASTFYALSSRTLSLGDTVTLLNLTPVFLALLAPLFLGERTSFAIVVALALSLAGVVLVVHPSFAFGPSTGGPSAALTAALAALAAFLASIAMMLLRRVGPTETAEGIAVHFSLFAAVSLGLLSLSDLRMPTPRDALFMVAAGLFAGLGQIAMTRAYSLERAARVGSMSYLAVVTSAILGAVVLGEQPSASALLGMALVVSGGLVVTLTRDKVAI